MIGTKMINFGLRCITQPSRENYNHLRGCVNTRNVSCISDGIRKLLRTSGCSLSNCYTASEKKVLRCYKTDRLLVRALYPMRIEDVPVKSDFRALQWELDEVVHNTERKSSSTTYIPYKVPVLPVGYLGILLDLEKCNLEGVYMHDAFVSRVDMAGRKIFWSNPLKTYVLHEDPSVAVDRSDIKHKAHLWQYKLDGPKQLKKLTQEVSLVRGKKPVEYNEVVVGYDKDSIIGVMATLNNTLHDNGISNKEILSDSKNFKSIISDRLNICVPVLRYNCSNGELY